MNASVSDEQHLRHHHFRTVSQKDWSNWKWQLKNRFKSLDELPDIKLIRELIHSELINQPEFPPFAITPYYYSLLLNNTKNNLLKSVIPDCKESDIAEYELSDPLLEEKAQKNSCIIHRYPNRVLFLTTQNCAVYCRYCTRSRLAGNHKQIINPEDWIAGFEYIKNHKEIQEVIISGGDPLYLSDDKIEFILSELSKISHVNLVRLGTKAPVVLPQRITDNLVNILKRFQPLYICLHIIHPDELTVASTDGLKRLIDAGCVVLSQTVLLKEINDQGVIMSHLMNQLLHHRIRPYALFHCDLIRGSRVFRTTINKGIEIIRYLREHASGLGVPHYIIDPPGGKVTIAPDNIIRKEANGYILKNWEGKKVFFPDG